MSVTVTNLHLTSCSLWIDIEILSEYCTSTSSTFLLLFAENGESNHLDSNDAVCGPEIIL